MARAQTPLDQELELRRAAIDPESWINDPIYRIEDQGEKRARRSCCLARSLRAATPSGGERRTPSSEPDGDPSQHTLLRAHYGDLVERRSLGALVEQVA